MKITLKLFATLGDYLPPGASYNQVELVLPDATTVAEAIAPLGLPAALVHLVLVNGVYLAPAERAGRGLNDGDQLAIWPPIAGG